MVTCITEDPHHLDAARAAVRGAGHPSSAARYIAARPLEVADKLADGAYDRGKLVSAAAYRDFVIEVVRKLSDQKGFQVLPRRWVVERTFGWMVRWRRLVRDYERRCDVSEAMVRVGMGALLLRRIAHP